MSCDLKHEIDLKVAGIVDRLCQVRHFLHQNPELSLQEYKTAAFVAAKLKDLGLEPKMFVDGRGVSAVIEGEKKGGRTVALRADMDALPIEEKTGLPYASKTPGVMHACGHDGHTTLLLGAAEVLLFLRAHFGGRVKLVFQPAEEAMGGARLMMNEGVLESPHVDAIFAFHGWPGMVVGEIGIRSGAVMAASDNFTITLTGKGSHAAYPELGLNPISALARLVQDLEAIPSTRISAAESAIITVTDCRAGTGAFNVIPQAGIIRGTFRTLSKGVREKIAMEISSRVKALEPLGYKAELVIDDGYPVTVNDSSLEGLVVLATEMQLGAGRILPVTCASMGSEDFAYYGEKVPAYYMRLGVGDRPSLHHPQYDFNNEALPAGVAMATRIAMEFLAE